MTRGWHMHQSRKRSLALAVAGALALCATEALAAVPPRSVTNSRLNHAAPPLGRLNIGAPVVNTALGSDDARFATTQNGADIVTLCTSAAVAATSPSATTEFCLDSEAVPPHDLLNASSLVSASVPSGDHTWPVISPNRTSVVASFAPAASAGASPAKPDLRPDHPPIPPPVLNIWAPVSANTSGGSGTWSLRSATWTDI